MSESSPRGKWATFGWPFSLALNRLVETQPWAGERLAPFAGQTVELRADPLPALRFTILPGGRLEAGGDSPAAAVTWTPGRAPEASGDEKLAAELSVLLRHLRWDFEEDLSRLFGDIAAHRLAEGARALAAWPADAAKRLGEALADYAVEEKRMLVARAELEELRVALGRLNEALERLEERMRRLG